MSDSSSRPKRAPIDEYYSLIDSRWKHEGVQTMSIIERVKEILLKPKEKWQTI